MSSLSGRRLHCALYDYEVGIHDEITVIIWMIMHIELDLILASSLTTKYILIIDATKRVKKIHFDVLNVNKLHVAAK